MTFSTFLTPLMFSPNFPFKQTTIGLTLIVTHQNQACPEEGEGSRKGKLEKSSKNPEDWLHQGHGGGQRAEISKAWY